MRLRQLFPPDPEGIGVDALDAYRPPAFAADPHRSAATPSAQRPWVTTNMVASVDGAMTLAGRSGGLGSAADKAVFRTLRSVADAVMAGAGTIRTERYGPVRLDEEHRAGREARGQAPIPPLVVVSNSGRLDDDLPLLDPALAGEGPLPILVTCAAGEAAARRWDDRVEVLVTGDATVDLPGALQQLVSRGLGIVVCEGGPTLNGALLANGLLDELCLTTSPLLAGGEAGRIVAGIDEHPVELELAHLLEADGALFARWRLRSPDPASPEADG